MRGTEPIIKPTKKNNIMDQETTNLWDYLTETGTATEDELCLVTSINGTSLDTLESVLYCRTGYRSLEQIQDQEA